MRRIAIHAHEAEKAMSARSGKPAGANIHSAIMAAHRGCVVPGPA